MSPRDGNRRRPLSREERVLWKAVTQSIVPRRKQTEIDIDEEQDTEPASPKPKTSRATPAPMVTAPVKPSAPPPLAPLGRRMK